MVIGLSGVQFSLKSVGLRQRKRDDKSYTFVYFFSHLLSSEKIGLIYALSRNRTPVSLSLVRRANHYTIRDHHAGNLAVS